MQAQNSTKISMQFARQVSWENALAAFFVISLILLSIFGFAFILGVIVCIVIVGAVCVSLVTLGSMFLSWINKKLKDIDSL